MDFILIVILIARFFQITSISHIDLIDLMFTTEAPVTIIVFKLFMSYYNFKIQIMIVDLNFN